MFEIVPLSREKEKILENTISSNAFYMIVGSALLNRAGLSVVRMADGEHHLMEEIIQHGLEEAWLNHPVTSFDQAWRERMGVEGISRGTLFKRLIEAANDCDYFAPSLSGINRKEYEVHSYFRSRSRFVDNFFVNAWTDEMKIKLYRAAGHVLFIHGNPNSARAFYLRLKYVLGVKTTYIQLSMWDQAEQVIEAAAKVDAPLVLFSAGPASKFIGPRIAQQGKVTLDLGHASDSWLLEKLHKEALSAEQSSQEMQHVG